MVGNGVRSKELHFFQFSQQALGNFEFGHCGHSDLLHQGNITIAKKPNKTIETKSHVLASTSTCTLTYITGYQELLLQIHCI